MFYACDCLGVSPKQLSEAKTLEEQKMRWKRGAATIMWVAFTNPKINTNLNSPLFGSLYMAENIIKAIRPHQLALLFQILARIEISRSNIMTSLQLVARVRQLTADTRQGLFLVLQLVFCHFW